MFREAEVFTLSGLSVHFDRNTQLFNKRVKLTLVLMLIMIISGAILYPSWLWFGAVLVVYIMHAVLWTDHFYYQPVENYSWKMPSELSSKAIVKGNRLQLSQPAQQGQTVLLKVRVSRKLSGIIYDPYVEIIASGKVHKQYFERSCSAERYINLSPAVEALSGEGSEIQIVARRCDIDRQCAELITFNNPDLANKRVMVIAPHADDAEIAAFGLYRNTDSMVVTLTAGEAEPETFSHYFEEQKSEDQKQVALLKGRVRAWDSVAIPKWAGVKEDRVVHLGYFCKHLERMHNSPEQPFESEFAGVSDTRLFRQFNSIKLASDQHGVASWNYLVEDLRELVESFKPDYIVTPHLTVDPHKDHHYSTVAVKQALELAGRSETRLLYYANHLRDTDMHPFGPARTLCSLPPVVGEPVELKGVFSFSLSDADQRDKILAVEMNHDLRRPIRFKKWLRKRLQKKLIGRYQPDYGEDEFLRKAIRVNELFFY